MKMKRSTIRIPEKLHEKIRRESFETGLSQNEIIANTLQKRYEEEEKMRILEFTDQEVIEGKNKADIGEDIIKVSYLEYKFLEKDIEAFTNQGTFTFRLTDDEIERLEEFEDSLTAGSLLNAGWEELDTTI